MSSFTTTPSEAIGVERLGPSDRALARETFALLAEVFEEDHAELSDAYVAELLGRADFWVLAARVDGVVVGGLTAHTLMMTRRERSEVFLYDIAVHPDFQRRGIGRRLVDALRAQAAAAGVHMVFVAADDEDEHAIDFYRALGATPAKATFFEYVTP